LDIITHSVDETRKLGRLIGTWIHFPLIITLTGMLGSGKTAFVQGLSRGLDVPDEYYITSPTYTLIHEFPGRRPLIHVDLYRLNHAADFEEIGLDDVLGRQAVIAIEWADRLCDWFADNHLDLNFEIVDDEIRRIRPIAGGHAADNLLKALRQQSDLELN
jgi:tRNA threonylcarbamoyladenosine biosynthesis protein TsaE